jgi:hypothetical protein
LLKEITRILKSGRILITSMDNWTSPIDTHEVAAHGAPATIFTEEEIKNALGVTRK